jgi:hypothetical protein
MDINKRAQQDLRYLVVRFNEKGCLSMWGGDVVSCTFKSRSPHHWKVGRPSKSEGASTQWKRP